MKKTFLGILFATIAANAAATTDYRDWWWNPAQSGMGLNIGQQGTTIFIGWYFYDAFSNPTFLTLRGVLSNNTAQGTLFRTNGPLPPGFDPNAVTATNVGSATITFTSDTRALFSYNFDGLSGTLSLQRFNFAQENLAGTRKYASVGTVSNCSIFPSENGPYEEAGTVSISQSGNSFTFTNVSLEGDSCTQNLTLNLNGSLYEGSGTFSCNFGVSGNVVFRNVRKIDDFIIYEYDAQATSGETCRDQGKGAAVK